MDSPHAVFTVLNVVVSLGIQRLLVVFYAMTSSSAQDTLTRPISLYLFPSVPLHFGIDYQQNELLAMQ